MKGGFDPILSLLRDATGVDFALYRENTVQRRILRRLALHDIGSLEEYRMKLETDPCELSALHRDLLINVTCFFRDLESFEHLNKLVFPRLAQDRPADAAIRIWVAGCATGEEAYSIAISLQEYFAETGHTYQVTIFASDISATAVERARSGKFSETIAGNVSPQRLNRYFSKVEGGYQIDQGAARDVCIQPARSDPRSPVLEVGLNQLPKRSDILWKRSEERYCPVTLRAQPRRLSCVGSVGIRVR